MILAPTVYIAAPWEYREAARDLRDGLRMQGLTIRATWLDANQDPQAFDRFGAYAQLCLDDIDASTHLVALQPSDMHASGTGGRHVEFGYALARSKTIVLIGERARNVFHYLPDVLVFGGTTTLDVIAAAIRA